MREISVVLGTSPVDPHGSSRVTLGYMSRFKYSESLKELEALPGYPVHASAVSHLRLG